MTREQAIMLLKADQANGDTEASHSHADRVLCDLLISLGYGDVIAEWLKVHKWYA